MQGWASPTNASTLPQALPLPVIPASRPERLHSHSPVPREETTQGETWRLPAMCTYWVPGPAQPLSSCHLTDLTGPGDCLSSAFLLRRELGLGTETQRWKPSLGTAAARELGSWSLCGSLGREGPTQELGPVILETAQQVPSPWPEWGTRAEGCFQITQPRAVPAGLPLALPSLGPRPRVSATRSLAA